MKIIHTSDWHLGQFFMGKSRQQEHASFLSWLTDLALSEAVDAVIVAGDIFDTGAPPSYARELYHDFIVAFNRATNNRVALVFVAGNHDSVAMLEETSSLLRRFNTHVVTRPSEDDLSEQVLSIKNEHDELKGFICCVPFLRARDMVTSERGVDGTQKKQDLLQAITTHYEDVYALAEAERSAQDKSIPVIMTGHLTVVGAKTSESVRDIYIGTLEAFSSNLFPNADYIALGHIHRSQKISAANEVYYSGSPLPLSFDELGGDKSVQLVEFKAGDTHVSTITIPRYQAMHRVKGDLAEISSQIEKLKEEVADGLAGTEETVWLDVLVQDQDYLGDLSKRIEEMVADSNIEVLCIKRDRQQKLHSLQVVDKERLQELSPNDVFDKRLAIESGFEAEQLKRLKDKFQVTLNEVMGAGEAEQE